ncbi:MAG: hypothetical protein ABSE06_01505 [Anaerolineaceae bacterium]|jgi:hypothetical protein
MGIHEEILGAVQTALIKALITDVTYAPEDNKPADTAVAGVVKIGPLQGDPDPDTARISVELYDNDPDQTIRRSGTGAAPESWDDTIYEIECGGGVTWKRRFTVKARCLLEATQEDLEGARTVASTVRSRIEHALLSLSLSGVSSENEYVSRGVFSWSMRSEMVQSGGPPSSYDYLIKVRFEVLTSETVGLA